MNEDLKLKLTLLPEKSGCYLMKNNSGEVIYVGKAKILKNRVKSYFTGAHNLKTTKLVSEIADFEYIITKSNKEAFLLEINLIKKYNPKYNILLKDDKTYPYIALTIEEHPRLYVTRAVKKLPNIKYYGPCPNAKAAKNTALLLNRTFPLRKCKNIKSVCCMYYHINQCLAPCIKEVTKDDYQGYLKQIHQFLNGDNTQILSILKDKMQEASNKLDFERALEYRDLIDDVKQTISHQSITVQADLNADFIGLSSDDINVSISILIMRNGKIIGNDKKIIPLITDINETVGSYLLQYYQEIAPKEIYLNQMDFIDDLSELVDATFKVPQKGIKAEILEMANANALKDLKNNQYIYEDKALKRKSTLDDFAKLLNIEKANYIEAFDNSNLYGEFPISAMVVYRDGQPSKSEFRKYHIKTVIGANDYQSMKEVIYRRYLRLTIEEKELPDLIIMDGGQIQVNAAKEVLTSLNLNISVCGIQKDDYHKAALIYYEGNKYKVDKNSDIYLFILNISETVHNFAIRFYRNEHTKGIFSSRLDNIKGLGKMRKEKLLKHFIRIEAIKEASIEEINSLGIPLDVCKSIKECLNKEDKC